MSLDENITMKNYALERASYNLITTRICMSTLSTQGTGSDVTYRKALIRYKPTDEGFLVRGHIRHGVGRSCLDWIAVTMGGAGESELDSCDRQDQQRRLGRV